MPEAIAPTMPQENIMPITMANQPTPAEQYDAAANSGNPAQMLSVAKEHLGTPVGTAAYHAANTLYKTSKEFDDLIGPIEKAGGVSTREGRIQLEQKFRGVKDNPDMWDVLLQYATGNKKYAMDLLTGGKVETNRVTDKNGKIIEVSTNALGKVVKARELGSPIDMSENEYQARGVGRQTYENTLNYINQKQINKTNIDEAKLSEKKNNSWLAASPMMAANANELYNHLNDIKKLAAFAPKEYADFMRYVSNSMGMADSKSKGSTVLDQAIKDNSLFIGKSIDKKLGASIGLDGGPWKWTATGAEREDGFEKKSFGELKQNTNTENTTNELNRNYQQTREALLTSATLAKLGDVDQKKFMRALDLAKELGQSQAILAKEGVPEFLSLPSSYQAEDKMGLGQAKAVQTMFNAKVMPLYQEYYNKAMKNAENPPNPRELEAGFQQTPEYRAALAEAKAETNRLLNEKIELAPAKTEKKTTAVAPPAKEAKAPPKKSLKDLVKEHGGS
jgi:hypothetical protein